MDLRQKVLLFVLSIAFLPFANQVSARSNLTGSTNTLFLLVTILSFLVLALVIALFVYFVSKFREENDETERKPLSHSTARNLEITWTLVATLIVILLMIFSYPVLINSIDAAQTSDVADEVIIVEGTGNWQWIFHFQDGSFIGPNNESDFKPNLAEPISWTEVTLDVGTRYQFVFFNSGRFIHSFYVHELNIKMDVVPGVNNTYTFEILEPGQYEILCAEYCGAQHSYMRGMIIAE